MRPLLPGGRALPAPRPHCPKARTAAAVKQREPGDEQQKRLAGTPSPHALLNHTTTTALPHDRVHLTHGTCRGALKGLLRIADPLVALAFSRVGNRALAGLERTLAKQPALSPRVGDGRHGAALT